MTTDSISSPAGRWGALRSWWRAEPPELRLANALVRLRRGGPPAPVPDLDKVFPAAYYRMPIMAPLRTHTETLVAPRPRLNVLLPHYNDFGVFAGIITAVAFGAKVAMMHPGCDLRFVFVDGIGKVDALRRDLRSVLGPEIDQLVFTSQEVYARPSLNIHPRDHFLATAWWTCYQARSALGPKRRFIYLIQDFECGFYPWNDWYANCLATYSMQYLPIFNTGILRDFCVRRGLVSAETAAAGGAFEPAMSRTLFSVPRRRRAPGEKRRLFFYGREGIARNLFPVGIAALAEAVAAGILDPGGWELVSAGQAHAPIELGRGAVLRSVGKMSLAEYAAFLSEVDIGLSLMLSPHPSYPPLEVAAAGALSITNVFENKDLSALSPNIISCQPSIDGVVAGLQRAVARLATETLDAPRPLNLPGSWDESFAEVVRMVHRLIDEERG